MKTTKQTRAIRRKHRVRSKVYGTEKRPRFNVFRSNTALYAQIIDDQKGITLVSKRVQGKNKAHGGTLGADIAAAAKALGITTVVFDRGGYRYHGIVAELADAARKGGLKF